MLVFVAPGSVWLSITAWDNLHTPEFWGYFWNPITQMDEPIYSSLSSEWWNLIMLMPTVVLIWWHSSIYFQILYAVSLFWLVFLIFAYRPCVDVPNTNTDGAENPVRERRK